MICTRCGTAHNTSDTLPGSGWIELVLWLFWLLPGVIYSIWRRGKRRPVCAACGSHDLVPLESPEGRRLVAKHYPDGPPRSVPRPAPKPVVRPGLLMVLGVLVVLIGTFPYWAS